MSAVVQAAWEGSRDDVRALLSADPSLRDVLGEVDTWDGPLSPLLAASLKGHDSVVELLLGLGADPDGHAVTLALGEGHHAVAERLVAAGAPIDACAAAGMRTVDVLRQMLAADTSLVGPATPNGATPLHHAATVEAVEVLLAHGADIDARDDYHGGTPFQWAFSNGERRVAVRDALRAKGCALDAFDHVALGDEAAVRAHLDAEPDALDRLAHVHDLHAHGGPLLHAAIRYGQADIVRELLDRGADVTVRGQRPLEATALHLAAFHDRAVMVGWLLDAGAEPYALDASYESTPLDWAGFNGCAAAEAALRARGITESSPR